MHEDRRARFIRVSDGAVIIQHWGDSHPVAVPPERSNVHIEGGKPAANQGARPRVVIAPRARALVASQRAAPDPLPVAQRSDVQELSSPGRLGTSTPIGLPQPSHQRTRSTNRCPLPENVHDEARSGERREWPLG